MFELMPKALMRPKRTPAFFLAATALLAPLARPANGAPVTCAIPQPCALYTNTVGSTVVAVTTGKSGKHAALMGTDASTNGGTNDGVFGIVGNGGWGVEGQSGDGSTGGGVVGTATTATGVYGYSRFATGVNAQSSFGTGLNAGSTLGIAINATSSNGSAINAISSSGNGITGTTSSTNVKRAAVMGIDASTNGGTNDGVFGMVGNGGWGVEGQSGDGSSGGGVVGTATTGTGVYGESVHTGVSGESVEADGVFGESENGTGVHGVADDPDNIQAGVLGEGLYGVEGNSLFVPFMGSDTLGHEVFEVDGDGDISYSGMLKNRTFARRGMVTTSYTTRSTAPNVENVGSGSLAAGTAAINFDPAFKAAIEPHANYQVFLSPGGDTKGLFVSAKLPTGFIVRESQGGHDSVAFDYRIVAPTLGHSSERMQLLAGIALGQTRTRKLPVPKFVVPNIVRMRQPSTKH